MTYQIILLLGGLALILFGANYLVDGSSSLAKKFGLSEFIIGLTIVGIGTSTPEMVVSFMASIKGSADMAIGNIVGSNIFNTLLILGVSALIMPLTITKSTLRKDIPINIGVTVLLILLGMNHTIFGIGGEDRLSRTDGVILLVLFALYMWRTFKSDPADDDSGEEESTKEYSIAVSFLLIAVGLISLIFGGRIFVNAATEVAKMFHVSEKFIAITVMAAGTSMPELATSVVAAIKGRGQLALGNVIGSNIANILLILGGSALINPLSFTGMTYVDLGTVLFCAIFLFISAYFFKRNKLDRAEGIILILMEAAYMWWLITNL